MRRPPMVWTLLALIGLLGLATAQDRKLGSDAPRNIRPTESSPNVHRRGSLTNSRLQFEKKKREHVLKDDAC